MRSVEAGMNRLGRPLAPFLWRGNPVDTLSLERMDYRLLRKSLYLLKLIIFTFPAALACESVSARLKKAAESGDPRHVQSFYA